MGEQQYTQPAEPQEIASRWETWLTTNAVLTDKIKFEHAGKPIDVDRLLAANRVDLDERHDYLFHD